MSSKLIEQTKKIDAKVKQLIKEEKLQEAYDLLKNELDTSFIPQPFCNDWERLLTELSLEIDESKHGKERKEIFKKLKRTDLLKNILNDNKTINFDFLDLYLYKFENIDDEQDTSIFQLIFNRKDIKQDQKMYLWVFLTQHSNHVYEFYNALIDKKETLTAKFLAQHLKETSNLISIVNKKTSKDVSQNKLADEFVRIINYYYFPSTMQKELNISNNEIAEMIIEELNNDYSTNPEGSNPILNKIIEYFAE